MIFPFKITNDEHNEISKMNVPGVSDQKAFDSPQKANTKSKATGEDRPRILQW